ncbi:MAG: hypothetical protein O8C62_05410 [Candidatus Methanoperedens sp.]|nr:hypothetical protein [Candidatus Methanoperedens sp.]
MNYNKKIIDISVAIGSLIGYITILVGVIMTILLLQTSFSV